MRRVNRYRCGKCPYIYDPRRGDPDGGIAPGTPFARIPDSWRCPVCGASKRDFVALDDDLPASAPGSAVSQTAPPAEADVVSPSQAASRRPTGPSYPAETWTVGSLKHLR
jgi:rubredoxin